MRLLPLLILGLLTCSNANTAEESPAIAHLRAVSQAGQELATAATPSVVFITTERTVGAADTQVPPMFNDPLFRRFFGEPGPGQQPPQDRRQMGQGSGFLISADGFILTNHHVAGEADRVTVLHDRREFTARVVGSDRHTDIALLKIEGDANLPHLAIGDSDRVAIGQWVMAIGNPFGLSHTVTSGIISARGRGQVGILDYEDFLQTDAAINPGNSGGPLVDLDGRAIGISTAIFSRSGGNVGIGFAIPINLAMQVVEQLKADGAVARGRIGIVIQDLTPDLAASFGLEASQGGIAVSQVLSDSPAAAAGLQVGDAIIAHDGKPVISVAAFRNAIALTRPGTTTTVTVWREGKRKDLTITVGRADEDAAAQRGAGAGAPGPLGLRLEALTDETRQALGAPALRGALIASVSDGSPAARAGLAPGMVIQQVDGQAVHSPAEVTERLRAAGDGPLRLLVWHEGSTRFVLLRRE